MTSDTTLREVIEILEKEYPTPKKVTLVPRSLPDWMRAEGRCEITKCDEAWSAAGREIH